MGPFTAVEKKKVPGVQTVFITVEDGTMSYQCDGNHEEGQPVILVANKHCVVRFPDPEVFGIDHIELKPGEEVPLYAQGGKKTQIEVFSSTKYSPKPGGPAIPPPIPW